MVTLSWIKCAGDVWCSLNIVSLDSLTDRQVGVYVIWHGGREPKTVRVGQGIIKRRLIEHRKDREIQSYSPFGLNVTWAYVQESYLDGIEAYLAELLDPLVGERFPDVAQIFVNSPYEQMQED